MQDGMLCIGFIKKRKEILMHRNTVIEWYFR